MIMAKKTLVILEGERHFQIQEKQHRLMRVNLFICALLLLSNCDNPKDVKKDAYIDVLKNLHNVKLYDYPQGINTIVNEIIHTNIQSKDSIINTEIVVTHPEIYDFVTKKYSVDSSTYEVFTKIEYIYIGRSLNKSFAITIDKNLNLEYYYIKGDKKMYSNETLL